MKVRALVNSLVLAAVSIGVVSVGQQPPAAPPQASPPRVRLSPPEIVLYKHARTLVDWTPKEIHDNPYLHKLRPLGSHDQLAKILDRVGQTCDLMFRDFPQVSCDEAVLSEASEDTLRPSRGVQRFPPQARKFRYIVIPHPIGDFMELEEYRTDSKGNPTDVSGLKDFYLITSNFVSTGLYMSPANQRDSRFRQFGGQMIRNRECEVVGFAQDPEKVHMVATFRSQDRSEALLVQGLAWIDAETFQLLRITTWLLAPRTDISLNSETSTVDFYPIQPGGSERVLWLPRDVAFEAVYQDVKVRNTHHYSNFKLFRVESTIKPTE